MKEIKFNGVALDEQMPGKIVNGGDIGIVKLSSQGILFETTDKLRINSHNKFRIIFNNKKTDFTARVYSVLIKCTVEKKNRNVPLYQVAAEFVNLKNGERTVIEDIIEQILENKLPVPHDVIQNAKFRIKE
jgi:hypothetical protein